MIEIAIQKKLNAASGIMHLDLDLQIESGQFLALYGKSGAGKTSVLRILAGLMKPDYGKIEVERITWLDSEQRLFLKPSKRKVGMVFQDYALFPNMTVRQNLLYALGNRKDHAFVNNLIEIVELGALQDRKPSKLSGGQQQRVALARALVQRPQLLLLDEPLSALDHEIRGKLQDHILRVHQEFGLTTILVSHNHAEVLKMADQVLMIEKGQITRQASPQEVFLSEQTTLNIKGIIEKIIPNANGALLHLKVGDQLITLQLDHASSQALKTGQKLAISTALNGIQVIQ